MNCWGVREGGCSSTWGKTPLFQKLQNPSDRFSSLVYHHHCCSHRKTDGNYLGRWKAAGRCITLSPLPHCSSTPHLHNCCWKCPPDGNFCWWYVSATNTGDIPRPQSQGSHKTCGYCLCLSQSRFHLQFLWMSSLHLFVQLLWIHFTLHRWRI